MKVQIVKDRGVAEIMIEDIFMSSHNSHLLVDYVDIRTVRRLNAFRFLYCFDLTSDEIDLWELALNDISIVGMSYCIVEIAYSKDMSYDMMCNLMRRIYGTLIGLPVLNCSHLSDEMSKNHVLVNLYFFSRELA